MRKGVKKEKPVIVTVTDNALKDIHQLAAQLEGKGMKVNRVLPVTGVISGSYPFALSKIKHVEGVQSVEEELNARF
jgi:hypothetical protein